MTHVAGLMLTLLGAHYFGDWYFQSRGMAMNKSLKFSVLLEHLSIVTLCLAIPLMFVFGPTLSLLFKLFVNAVIHGIIDWNIWKGYKNTLRKRIQRSIDFGMLPADQADKAFNEYPYWKDKPFYDTIGIDQLLHVATLAILFS